MNFTQEIKRDLIKKIPENRCCKCALLAAGLETAGEWWSTGFSFKSENEDTAAFVLKIVNELFGVQMTVTEAVRDPKHGRDKITFSYEGEQAFAYADEIFSHGPAGNMGECCPQAYLRGAFLFAGSCTLPREGKKTGYHLEVVFQNEYFAQNFRLMLDELQIIGNIVERNDKFVVYLKSREAISDFLSLIEANKALKKLESISAAREESNQENRVLNCMANNADRAATASAEQAIAFAALEKSGAFVTLSEPLKEVASARLAYPTLSLTELAEKLNISRSCLNHRLRKLMKIYAEQKK